MLTKSQTKFKQTEIGEIPEDWNKDRLGSFGTFKNGINFNRSQFGKGYKVINVKQLYGGRFVDTSDLEEVNSDVIKNKDYLLEKGDVLFTRSSLVASGAGQVSMYNENKKDITFSGFIIKFKNNKKEILDNYFLNYLLRFLYRFLMKKY